LTLDLGNSRTFCITSNYTWHSVIEASFARLDEFLKTRDWNGRENEVVNLFAHEFLPMEIRPDSVFYSLSQIGIEVAVWQVSGSRKKYVRKDLVLWNEPLLNPWHKSNPAPAAIIEWKRNDLRLRETDIEWLQKFTNRFPQTIGYSACAMLRKNKGVDWKKVEAGFVC